MGKYYSLRENEKIHLNEWFAREKSFILAQKYFLKNDMFWFEKIQKMEEYLIFLGQT